MAFTAISVKLSGATAPSTFPFSSSYYYRAADGGLGGGDGGFVAVVNEWAKFLSEGLALDLLAEHFEGATSALMCL